MCTAFKYKQYFCRNYDYEQSYKETVKLIPKNIYGNTYGIIGIATGLVEDYPLLYDGMNEYGLCMGGLAFSGNAKYEKEENVPYGDYIYAPYEFILQILGNFKNVRDVKKHLEKAHIIDKQYSDDFQNSDLHWIISDKEKSIVVESTNNGLQVYDNEYEVLTNNPPFSMMSKSIENNLKWIGCEDDEIADERYYSRGFETEYLDGSYTSMGRFERVTYLKEKALTNDRITALTQAVHLLSSIEQIYGATPVDDKYEYTIYSAIYDMVENKVMIRTYDRTMYLTYLDLNETEPVTFNI